MQAQYYIDRGRTDTANSLGSRIPNLSSNARSDKPIDYTSVESRPGARSGRRFTLLRQLCCFPGQPDLPRLRKLLTSTCRVEAVPGADNMEPHGLNVQAAVMSLMRESQERLQTV